ncbi:MAG: PAS domain S-box protein, partial [Thermodesulfobacteriota bacterium]
MNKIDNLLFFRKEDIKAWAVTDVMQGVMTNDADERITKILSRLKRDYGVYSGIFCINTKSKIIASSDLKKLGQDVSGEPWFKEVLKTSGLHISDLEYDEIIGGFSVKYTIPIVASYDEEQIIGFLSSSFNWSELFDITNSIQIGKEGQAESGYALLMNKMGSVISGPGFILAEEAGEEELSSRNLLSSGYKSAHRGVKGEKGFLVETSTSGKELLIGYAGSQGYRDFKGLGWTLLIMHDTKEAFLPVIALRNQFIIIGSGVGIIIFVLAILVSRGISIPIKKLTTAVNVITEGDLSYRAEVKSRDEIGVLATKFNKMADGLINAKRDWESTFDSVKDMIVLYDKDGKITRYNNELLSRLNVKPEDIIGKKCYEVFYVDEKERNEHKHECKVTLAAKTKKSSSIEKESTSLHGTFLFSTFPRFSDKGEFTGVVQILSDITERKKAENELHTKNSYLKLLQVAAVAANEAVDIKNAFQPVLEEICSSTGWEIGHAYVISKDDPNLLEPTSVWRLKDHKHFKEFCDVSKEIKFAKGIGLPGRVLASRIPHWIVDVTKDKNFLRTKIAKAVNIKSGIAFPVMVGAKVVAVMTFFTTKVLEPDQQFLDIMADVGTQLGRTIERKQAENALRESEKKLRLLSENIRGVFWISDPRISKMIYVSPAYEKIWGRTCKSLYKNPKSFLESVYPEDSEYVLAALKKHTQGEYDVEYRIVQPDGSICWIWDRGFPIRNEKGELYLMAGIAEDITERKKMEEELIKAKKLESVGILAGGISHDFNNNLQAILSSINLAETCTDSKDEIYKILEEAKKVILRSKNLTRQLLTFSKGGEPVKNTIFVSKLIR